MTSVDQCTEQRGPRVLYLTTNDIEHPVRGCDRRSWQLYRWMASWTTVTACSYTKHTSDNGASSDANRRTLAYPRIAVLAPFNPAMFAQLFRMRADGTSIDIVVASGMGSLLYAIVARFLFGARLVVDCHNVESQLSQDLDDPAHYVFSRTVERAALRLADLVLVTSERDRGQFPSRISEKSIVMANGYDQSTFHPEDRDPTSRILFFGNMNYQPNAEAIEEIATHIAPILSRDGLEVEIHIAGPHCDEIRSTVANVPGVTVVGLVDDIADYIRGSAVVIVPLRTGSGTRLKIIESLACGTPVVSTPKGAEGWPRSWPSLVVTELEAFPEAVCEVLENDLTPTGTELSEIREYTWEEQVGRLRPYFSQLDDHPFNNDS